MPGPNYYTGIGSRRLPKDMRLLMIQLAKVLASKGWVLRSGGAPGSDDAFEQGSPNHRQRIYIPWSPFEGRRHGVDGALDPQRAFSKELYEKARALASQHHPGWLNLKEPVRKLMTRNAFQVLGDDLETPSKFVWCWAPLPKMQDGKLIDVDGGTGLAIRLARSFNIPCYNMIVPEHMAVLEKYLLENQVDPLACDEARPRPRL